MSTPPDLNQESDGRLYAIFKNDAKELLPAILTFNEASKLLRISAPTLRELLIRGIVPGQRIGKQWRINTQSLLDYVSGKSLVPRSRRKK